MMSSDFDVWAEVGGALVAAAVLPFYMGVLHLTVVELLLYTVTAGGLLSAGEQLRYGGPRSFRIGEFLADLPLWSGLILGPGLVTYVAAVLLI